MITLYGIPNCDTVKKARLWLDEREIACDFHNYKKDGIIADKIQQWLEQYPWEKLVNRAGMTYRKLSDEEKAAVNDNESATALMLGKNSVIKRPIVERDGKILAVGFKEAEYEALF